MFVDEKVEADTGCSLLGRKEKHLDICMSKAEQYQEAPLILQVYNLGLQWISAW